MYDFSHVFNNQMSYELERCRQTITVSLDDYFLFDKRMKWELNEIIKDEILAEIVVGDEGVRELEKYLKEEFERVMKID